MNGGPPKYHPFRNVFSMKSTIHFGGPSILETSGYLYGHPILVGFEWDSRFLDDYHPQLISRVVIHPKHNPIPLFEKNTPMAHGPTGMWVNSRSKKNMVSLNGDVSQWNVGQFPVRWFRGCFSYFRGGWDDFTSQDHDLEQYHLNDHVHQRLVPQL